MAKKEPGPRFVALYHWVTDTEAWQDLDANARCTYALIARRYNGPGSNNGKIPYSVREVAEGLRIGKTTAHRALASLQDHGFIVLTTKGAFNMKHRHATEWLLTEFKDDRPGKSLALSLPSKDFARWRKLKHGSATDTHRYPQRNRSVPDTGQSPKVTMAYGSATGTVGTSDGSATGTLYSLPGGTALSTPTEAAPLAEEAPVHTGRAHRSEQAVDAIEDISARSNKTVHVSEALIASLNKNRAYGQKAIVAPPSTIPQPSDSATPPTLDDGQRSLLRWLVGFDGPATHRKAQQNLSNVLKGEAIADAANALAGHSLISIEEKGRSRVYALTDAGRNPALLHDPDQFDLVDWLSVNKSGTLQIN